MHKEKCRSKVRLEREDSLVSPGDYSMQFLLYSVLTVYQVQLSCKYFTYIQFPTLNYKLHLQK